MALTRFAFPSQTKFLKNNRRSLEKAWESKEKVTVHLKVCRKFLDVRQAESAKEKARMVYQKQMTPEDQKKFAARMKAFRKKYGLTQPDLGAALGCSERTIRSLERCENAPFPQTLVRFDQLIEKYKAAEDAELDVLEGVS